MNGYEAFAHDQLRPLWRDDCRGSAVRLGSADRTLDGLATVPGDKRAALRDMVNGLKSATRML